MTSLFKAGAPGSIILMGEYAVLQGAPAVLMTLKRRLTVTLSSGPRFSVTSDRFAPYTEGEGEEPPHAQLLRRVLSRAGAKPDSIHIRIQSDIPHTYGFGSSAALVAATVRAAFRQQGREEIFADLFKAGHAAILDVHGRGSGADLAASLCDMPFVLFDPSVPSAEAFHLPFCVQAVYTGYKTPTPQVLKTVAAQTPKDEWDRTIAQMTAIARVFAAAPTLDLIEKYQGLMERLGVFCLASRKAAEALRAAGAVPKISGSGLGDCVVGFSERPVRAEVDPPLEFIAAGDLR